MSKIVELKVSEAAHYDSIHHWLADKLELPASYGHNLDALWDCLTGNIEKPLTIIWMNDAPSELDFSAYTDILEEAAGEDERISFGYLMTEE